MEWEFLLAGVMSVLLAIYLTYALIYPEKF
jgi:K+-transporting ATPase KdpF subunit